MTYKTINNSQIIQNDIKTSQTTSNPLKNNPDHTKTNAKNHQNLTLTQNYSKTIPKTPKNQLTANPARLFCPVAKLHIHSRIVTGAALVFCSARVCWKRSKKTVVIHDDKKWLKTNLSPANLAPNSCRPENMWELNCCDFLSWSKKFLRSFLFGWSFLLVFFMGWNFCCIT